MKKSVVCLLLVALCFSFSGCALSDISFFSEKAAFELMNGENEVTVSAGEKTDYYISVNVDSDFLLSEVQCISENESVATVEYRHILWERELHYYINGVSQGETYIYFSSPDGKTQSEKIKVTVLPQTESEKSLTQPTAEPETPAAINTLFLQVGQTSNKFGFSLSGLNAVSKDNIALVSENSLVSTVWYDTLTSAEQVFFTVTGVSEGKTCVYLSSKDGMVLSGKIEVVVEPTYKDEATDSGETTTADDSSPVFIKETSPSTQTTTTITETSGEIPETVYITPTGRKYHFRATCAGENATAIALSEAKSSYEPCKRCAHE